ncbi:MAG: efflux RND transporter permease subunit [Gemmatimonadales bacterium]
MTPRLRPPAGMVRLIITIIGSAIVALVFLAGVDLKPRVDEAFFFSSHDRALRADSAIVRTFPDTPLLIVLASGDLRSPSYVRDIGELTAALHLVPGVTSVESLAEGPKDVDDALESPLWRRLLITGDERGSYLVMGTNPRAPTAPMVDRLQAIQQRFDRPGFRLAVSGGPYITELISRNLEHDLRVFSLAAALVFGLVLFAIFRRLLVVAGALLACFDASATTLAAAHLLHIPIGPLTANLSTMVFVMTLSPIVFLTFNWTATAPENIAEGRDAVRAAIRRTITPSFWSSVCMTLGFASLLLVASTPMRNLGMTGAIGAALALASAYLVHPSFLALARRPEGGSPLRMRSPRWDRFFARRHPALAALIAVVTVAAAAGLPRLDTDPPLPQYFHAGGPIRTGLERVDRAGGSTPLKLVVRERDGAPLNHHEGYERLKALQQTLEADPSVGSVMSLAPILAEAHRAPFAFLASTEHLIHILDSPKHGSVGRQFINGDRTEALFFLRMRESTRKAPRRAIINRLIGKAARDGFRTVSVGGLYNLQSRMSALLTTSIVTGVLLLLGIFSVMGLVFSRSWRVAAALLVSLVTIPVIIRGTIAWLGVPLDFVTASAANLDLGMGVDAMIYLTMRALSRRRNGDSGAAWSEATRELWRPIGTSLLIICCGFGVFLLSSFPPTQRFGCFVIAGSLTATASALLVFPTLARGRGPDPKRRRRDVHRRPRRQGAALAQRTE